MLIRFSVENFLSFKDEVEFSMIKGKSRIHPEHVVSNGKSSLKLLKAGVIYGANASGKSNLIKAMYFARDIVVIGTRLRGSIPVKPFKFDADCEGKPSKFQFEFKHKSKSFIYGFRLDSQRIHEEWLYEITPTTEKPIFERKTNLEGKTEVEFSNIEYKESKDRQFLAFTAKGTRPNQLFLTESIERNVSYFRDAYEWFDKVLVIVFPMAHSAGLDIDSMTSDEFKHAFQDFLQLFDTGISGIDVRQINIDENASIPNEIEAGFTEMLFGSRHIEETNKGRILVTTGAEGCYLFFEEEEGLLDVFKFMTTHEIKGKNHSVSLEVGEESDGTQRLFDLIPVLMDLFGGERVIVVDELDRSLHPHLSYKILELFLNNKPQQKSQLIVTTHESSLMDLDLLRRDEIWFIEKNKEGVSTVYSLEEFAPRYDKELRKGYLLGRFGAIPFIRNVHNLSWIK